MPVKKNKKRNYKKVQRQQKRAAAGESIDKRPKEIDTREEFGNWEMDSVLGKRGKSKKYVAGTDRAENQKRDYI